MDSISASILNYITIQLYAYMATRRVFDGINRRRLMRKERRNREFSDIENFTSLLVSFVIAGIIFTGASELFPALATFNTPIWAVDFILIAAGYFIARSLGLLRNPYA